MRIYLIVNILSFNYILLVVLCVSNATRPVKVFMKVFLNVCSFLLRREFEITLREVSLFLEEVGEKHEELFPTKVHNMLVYILLIRFPKTVQLYFLRLPPFVSPAQLPALFLMGLHFRHISRAAELVEILLPPFFFRLFSRSTYELNFWLSCVARSSRF